jgi:hypothetical protein
MPIASPGDPPNERPPDQVPGGGFPQPAPDDLHNGRPQQKRSPARIHGLSGDDRTTAAVASSWPVKEPEGKASWSGVEAQGIGTKPTDGSAMRTTSGDPAWRVALKSASHHSEPQPSRRLTSSTRSLALASEASSTPRRRQVLQSMGMTAVLRIIASSVNSIARSHRPTCA